MTLTKTQKSALEHLRAAYIGPESDYDEVLFNRPNLQYSVGMLFPAQFSSAGSHEDRAEDESELDATVPAGEIEESGAGVPLAEEWRPTSVALSFVTDSTEVVCRVAGGTYAPIVDDGPPRWQRQPFEFSDIRLGVGRRSQFRVTGEVPFEVGSLWRPFGDSHLVTVHIKVHTSTTGDDKLDIPRMLFQVELEVTAAAGGQIQEYFSSRAFEIDEEATELRLRYRNRKIYGVGHGMAADWKFEAGRCAKVFLDPVPSFVVPQIETTGFAPGSPEARALRLDELARMDTEPEPVLASLDAFVSAFAVWVTEQEARVGTFDDHTAVAKAVVGRARSAVRRMEEGVKQLRVPGNGTLRQAFSMGMAAMRLQMLQTLKTRNDEPEEPKWRPFQLGFLLVSLASTVDAHHPDREVVDLIWFPTGGGKTEAYLGLAAIEVFRRRLAYGIEGGGTAVITRYTLRLLTAQQFQRAAALICAMEILRKSDPRAKGLARFSIGLWVGNEATPATLGEAKKALERMHRAARPEEANSFQVESCPWCFTPLVPAERSSDRSSYGVKLVGHDVIMHCTDMNCEFHDELPLSVIDDVLYQNPPTILLATVDKFARLQFKPEAGSLLGLSTNYEQPSMIIQDELHLLSGPLGTTVAVFDAVIQLLLSRGGTSPKIVASTATIRASGEQIQGLYGRSVQLYPPAGLDDDSTFFSRPVKSGEGRLYVGLMPQSLSQASALVATTAPLVEIPEVLTGQSEDGPSRDAFWTLVMYHNSLRELGRSGTLVVDDVNGRLETRADRLGIPLRRVRAGRVLELTSRKGPEELPNDLRELRSTADRTDEAIDVVLSSNMLSVGIDIPRLALMLMVGQPKTTAEYIQATSRVGRGKNNGIIVTLFRSNRARDRSQFETFRGYHEALYRSVEPTSVTPWSMASRERSLAGALVALVRQTIPMLASDAAAIFFDLDNDMLRPRVEKLVEQFMTYVERSDSIEEEETRKQIWMLLREWDRRARAAREENGSLRYDRRNQADQALLKRFGQAGEGWLVGDSMRSVEPNVAVEVREPNEEGQHGTDQA
ncbi:helicase-related protein [Nocardia sp. bgisy118]|uniref:helicase-related protein n=1 Tax=Nocardia sp. bgisy118 TaxID=3413786 RepID=UPI003F49E77D